MKKVVFRKIATSFAERSYAEHKFELGVLDEPRTTAFWCDRRICEGFWGWNEKDVEEIVEKLNTPIHV